MIPKRMAFFWSGGPLSWLRHLSVKSFLHYNPDWEVEIHVCRHFDHVSHIPWKSVEKQDFVSYEGRDYLEDLTSERVTLVDWIPDQELTPVHQSDIARWKHLVDKGGFYSDFDILYTDSMSSLDKYLKEDLILPVNNRSVPIGFLGSSKGSEFFKLVHALASSFVDNEVYQSGGCDIIYRLLRVRPYLCDVSFIRMITMSVGRKFPEIAAAIFEGVDTVYPYEWTEVGQIFGENSRWPTNPFRSFGIHWYAGSPQAQKLNLVLNEDNYHSYPCLLTDAIARIL